MYLRVDSLVIGRRIHIADHSEGDGKSVIVAHERQLQLQGVVLTMGIVHQHVVYGVAVLAYLHHLESESLLHQSVSVVFAEDQLLAVAHIYGVLQALSRVVHRLVRAIVEYHAVLQHFHHRRSLVGIGSLESLHGVLAVGSHRAGEEMSARSEAEFCRTERVLHSAIGR